jgi:hypothetical protein
MSLVDITHGLAFLSFAGAAIASLRAFIYAYPTNLRRLSVLWIFLFLLDLIGNILMQMHIKNHWVYNVFNWVWYPSLAYLYYSELNSRLIKQIIVCFLIMFPILVLWDSLTFESIKSMQSIATVLGGGFITFLAAGYFRQLYLSEQNDNITSNPWFWFSSGFVVYFAGASVPYIGMLNYLVEEYRDFAGMYYRYIYLCFAFILHLLIITGFLCRTNYQRSP